MEFVQSHNLIKYCIHLLLFSSPPPFEPQTPSPSRSLSHNAGSHRFNVTPVWAIFLSPCPKFAWPVALGKKWKGYVCFASKFGAVPPYRCSSWCGSNNSAMTVGKSLPPANCTFSFLSSGMKELTNDRITQG